MGKTEVKIESPSLVKVLSYKEIAMPLFQRRYGWGSSGKENAAVAYFEQFLANKETNNFFGALFLHSLRRWDYGRDYDISVYITDGQHRMVTVVIAALALQKAIQSKLARGNAELHEEEQDDLQNLLECPILKIASSTNIEAVIDEYGTKVQVVKFIEEQLLHLGSYASRAEAIDASYKSKREKIKAEIKDKIKRKTLLKESTDEKRERLTCLQKEIRKQKSIPLFASFNRLYELLSKKRTTRLIRVAEHFREKLNNMCLPVHCLQPIRDYGIELSELEAEAFSMFSQMNGQVFPLTEGELLKAYIDSNSKAGDVVHNYFKKNTPERKACTFMGFDSNGNICEYVARRALGESDFGTYTWVQTALYSPEPADKKIKEVAHSLNLIYSLHQKIGQLSAPYSSLYQLFFHYFKRMTFAVYASRCMEGDVPRQDDAFLKTLFKLLVLLEISSLYVPPIGKRLNLSRDLTGVKMNTLRHGFELVMKHFGAASVDELKDKISHLLAEYPIGILQHHRNLAKVLLVVADATSAGKEVQLSSWPAYEYEHIFPVKNEHMHDDDCSEAMTARIETILQLPSEEKSKLVHRLGNGALLNKKQNAGLGNGSPEAKIHKTVEQEYYNAWWTSHLQDIQSVEGLFGLEEINDRSWKLAHKITETLIDYDFVEAVISSSDAV